MKILKIALILFAVNLCFIDCKEAVDKQKENPNLTEEAKDTTALFAKTIAANDFKSIVDSNAVVVIDVRVPEQYNEGHIPGAININWINQEEFVTKIKALAKDKTVMLYCNSGHRSGLATQYLKEQGFEKIYNLGTGIDGWKAENYEIEK